MAALVAPRHRVTEGGSKILPAGTELDVSVLRARNCLEEIKSCSVSGDPGDAMPLERCLYSLVGLVDVGSNPRSYRQCQDVLAETDVVDVLLRLLSTDRCEGHEHIWVALAVLSFNHAALQQCIVCKDCFWNCLKRSLSGAKITGPSIMDQFSAIRALMSVAQCPNTHRRMVPMLAQITALATGEQPSFAAIGIMAIEVLVNVSANREMRPQIAKAFSSKGLRNLVAQVKATGKQEHGFALAILLANLGTHTTQDGRGCLGSALDWVPFKDLNVFASLVSALEATTKQHDWPPGSNVFHSAQRLTSLMHALAISPMIEAAYSAELSQFVVPLMGLVALGIECAAACEALTALARVPRNFGLMTTDEAFLEDLRRLVANDGLEEATSLLQYLEKYKDVIVVSGGGILWRSTELVAHFAGEAGNVEWRLPYAKPEVDQYHVTLEVRDLTDEVDVSTHDPSELLGVLPGLPQEEVMEEMAPWCLNDIGIAEMRLEGIVAYCTGTGCHGAGTFNHAPEETSKKLQMIAQLLSDRDASGRLPILLLLAAHGGMCNVQKEVGIASAYAQLTRTFAVRSEKTSFQACVFRLLRDKREALLESIAVEHCTRRHGFTNTHYLVPFRNKLGAAVGLAEIADPNGIPCSLTDEEISDYTLQFWHLYSADVLIAELDSALNAQPRKIPYDVFIAWLEQNVPAHSDKYSFLGACFDAQGNVRSTVLQHALCRLGVLRSSSVLELDPLNLTVQQGALEWHGLDAFVTLANLWDLPADAEMCSQVLTDLYATRQPLSDGNEAIAEYQKLLAIAESHFESRLETGPSALECLVAGPFVQDELSTSMKTYMAHHCPLLRALLDEAKSFSPLTQRDGIFLSQ